MIVREPEGEEGLQKAQGDDQSLIEMGPLRLWQMGSHAAGVQLLAFGSSQANSFGSASGRASVWGVPLSVGSIGSNSALRQAESPQSRVKQAMQSSWRMALGRRVF